MKKSLMMLVVAVLTVAMMLSLVACQTEISQEQVQELMQASTVNFVNSLTGEQIDFAMYAETDIMVQVGTDIFELGLSVDFAVNAVFGEEASLSAMMIVDIDMDEDLSVAMDMGNDDGSAIDYIEFYYYGDNLYAGAFFNDGTSSCNVEPLYLAEMLCLENGNPIDAILAEILGEGVVLTTDNLYLVQDEIDALLGDMSAGMDLEFDSTSDPLTSALVDFVGSVFSSDNLKYVKSGDTITVTLDGSAILANMTTALDTLASALNGTAYEGFVTVYGDICTPDTLDMVLMVDLSGGTVCAVVFSFVYCNDNLVLDASSLGGETNEVGIVDISVTFGFEMSFDSVTIELPDYFANSSLS